MDYILDIAQCYVPIEVKWSDASKEKDAKHLIRFLDEYQQASQTSIICRTPRRYKIRENITAIPWQEISLLIESCAV